MSSEFQTQSKQILDAINSEIVGTNIFPKELCCIISDYSICFYTVVKCPDNKVSLSNNVYLSGSDFTQEMKYIKIDKYVYNVCCDLRLYPNEIALNGCQRENLKINIGVKIPI